MLGCGPRARAVHLPCGPAQTLGAHVEALGPTLDTGSGSGDEDNGGFLLHHKPLLVGQSGSVTWNKAGLTPKQGLVAV